MNIDIAPYYKRKNLTFQEWIENRNKISKEELIKDYEDAIKEVKNKIPKDQKKQGLMIKELEKCKKEDIEILKKENEKIKKWKDFKELFRKIEVAVDVAKNDLSELESKLELDSDFLKDFRKYMKRGKELYGIDFDKESKSLIKKAEDSFKKSGLLISNYLPSGPNLLRRFISLFGRKSEVDPREKMSDTVDGTDNSDMFGGVDQKKRLIDIAVLEAHDAGSYTMKPLSSTDLFGQGAQTQSGNITSMLKAGARSFDMRVKLVNNVPVFYHGIVTGGSFVDAARQIVKFLKSHRNEVIIIKLDMDDNCVKKIIKMNLMKEFLDLVYYPENKKATEITIDDMVSSNKRILILRYNEYKGFCLSEKDVMEFHWNPKIASSEDPNVRLSHEKEFLEKNQGKGKFTVSSEVRTPMLKSYLSIPLRKLLGKSKVCSHAPLEEAKENKNSEDYFFNMDSVKKFANIIGIDDVRSKANRAKIVKEWNKARSSALKEQKKM